MPISMVLCSAELLERILDNQRVISDIVLVNLKQAFRPPSTGKESHGSNTRFRESTIKFYGMGERPTCMVLHEALPGKFLVAGHLYAVRWTQYARVVMGSSFNVNSPRNGIIWCSALGHEYERQRICFSYGDIASEFILHVLDKSLLPVKLSSVGQHTGNKAFKEALGDVTFGDLHNKRVDFAGADGTGPFKHALALHAKFALELCAKTYPDDFDPREYLFDDDRSEYEGKQAFIRMWLGQLDTGSVAEGAEGNEEEEEASVDPEESVDVEVDVERRGPEVGRGAQGLRKR
ncbi:hypothetical protein TSOC_009225 [Tetrabaena socialis]|uniref:Uncharacterized protein n=1 Tax=Tetrabaena socialis TaxID=47790 RepID=A0A2J7ZWF1_9CHLO|nr:hypothetical protein TSOC_009225 [Tetrabaena socialis]|eukprot:PNH04586.1 hypothetical protein TSOC_009225 [Tetrabaena socialis]